MPVVEYPGYGRCEGKVGPATIIESSSEAIKRLSEILETDEDNISIKATTHEKTDAVGREESMIAQAVALIVREGS